MSATSQEDTALEFTLEKDFREAVKSRRKRDPMQEIKDYLESIGEDWRDFTKKELIGLIRRGF